MDKNKEKNNSDTTKASYMDQIFWKIAFLSDGIANCINCCYNFDSHKFATELNNIYRDLSDDEIRTISERKILPVFSETSITNIPSSNLSYYNKTCLLMGLQVNYSCSYLGEPLKMILAHTNRILSLENIPIDIYAALKMSIDPLQKFMDDNIVKCKTKTKNIKSEEFMNERTRLFLDTLYLAMLYYIENDKDLYMTVGEFEKFRGREFALNSLYEKGLKYAVNNKLKVYKQAIEEAGISGLYEIKAVQAGKKEKYCPVDLFIAEWLYLNDEKDKDNDEGDRSKGRIPLLYIFDLIYEKKGMFKKTLSKGNDNELTIVNALLGYIEIINRICDMEDPKEFTLAFFAFFKFEMTHHFSSLILFADYWKDNYQEQLKYEYGDFTYKEDPNYAVEMYEKILSPFISKDGKITPSPFVFDLSSRLNNIFNDKDYDFAIGGNLIALVNKNGTQISRNQNREICELYITPCIIVLPKLLRRQITQ